MKEESRRNVLNQLSSTGNGQKRREGCRDTGALVLCANNLSHLYRVRLPSPSPQRPTAASSNLLKNIWPRSKVCPIFSRLPLFRPDAPSPAALPLTRPPSPLPANI